MANINISLLWWVLGLYPPTQTNIHTIHPYICTQAHAHAQIGARPNTRTNTCTPTNTHARAWSRTHAPWAHGRTHAHTHPPTTHAYKHSPHATKTTQIHHSDTRARAHIHTYVRTRACTHASLVSTMPYIFYLMCDLCLFCCGCLSGVDGSLKDTCFSVNVWNED